ncbi:MAG: hypothetical protein EXS42_02680 [Lacunisphaera sp.]|nr:hypothetical protein [Lacunisphaera sp.]
MASLTGSSPGSRRRFGKRGALALAVVLAVTAGAGEMPDYVRQALAQFSTDVPKGWAYTITTVRHEQQVTERYNPARPPAEQWTLLRHNSQLPSAREIERYAKSRAGGPSAAPQATFQKADLEPGSVELVRADAERGEFRCAFRAESTGADKMLGHLSLRLIVSKRQPHIEQFVLELITPYSPVLGVKMHELLVQMKFAAPGADRPSLPAASSSHFIGRIFFIRVEEDLRVSYSDFVRAD